VENSQQIEQVIVPVEEKIYKYQPTDAEGRPIGGAQVIKYTTVDELRDKLTEQNVLLVRKLREQTKKVRLGIEEREELPEDIQHADGFIQFAPRDLSDEERYDIARRLADPTTSAQATQELIEASVGAPLDSIGKTLQSTQQEVISLRAKLEANAFVADNPDYYRCQENFEAITSWMVRYDLAPVKANFQKAYDTLKAQGLLIEGAAPVVEIVAPVVEVPIAPLEPVQEQVVQHRIPSGLTREMSSDSGVPLQAGSEITYKLPNGQVLTGLAAIAAMPGEEYKTRLLRDKNFGKLVDKLEADARKPRG